MDIVIFAIIAIVLCYRLYTVLGRNEDSILEKASSSVYDPNLTKAPSEDKLDRLLKRYNIPAFLKPAFSAILLKDPTFDFKNFLTGAEGAYIMILTHAFEHKLEPIHNYISPAILSTLQTFQQMDRARIKIAGITIVNAEFTHPTASITVQFKATVHNKLTSTNRLEDWVFARNLNDENPTWILKEMLPIVSQ